LLHLIRLFKAELAIDDFKVGYLLVTNKVYLNTISKFSLFFVLFINFLNILVKM